MQTHTGWKDNIRQHLLFNSKTKKHTLTAVIAAGLFFVMMVVFTAFASHLAYANNQLQKENQDLANEVQSLKVDIKSAMNIGTIETAASETWRLSLRLRHLIEGKFNSYFHRDGQLNEVIIFVRLFYFQEKK